MTDTLYTQGTRVRFAGGVVMSEVIAVPQQAQGVVIRRGYPASEEVDPWQGDLPNGMIMVRWDHNDKVVAVFTNEVEKAL